MTNFRAPEGETKPLIAIVLPCSNEAQQYEIYVIWKLVRHEGDNYFKIVACQNVVIPGLHYYYDETEIIALHQRIKTEIASKPNIGLKFLFQNS